jgi:hypothetical protein
MYLYVLCALYSRLIILLKKCEVIARICRHRFMWLVDKMSWTLAAVFTLRRVSRHHDSAAKQHATVSTGVAKLTSRTEQLLREQPRNI